MGSDLTKPENRTERFLAKIAGLVDAMPEGQFSRLERYLAIIATNSGIDYVTDEELSEALEDKQDKTNYTAAQLNQYVGMVAANPNSAGFAPTGYGIGGESKLLTQTDNLDNVVTPGFYHFNGYGNNSPTGGPDKAIYTELNGLCVFQVEAYSNIRLLQTIKTIAVPGIIIQRIINSEGVSAWEWLNPPMVEGVEYRTAERFLGKPVYQKVVNCTGLPSGTSAQPVYKNFNYGVANVSIPISAKGILYTVEGYPYPIPGVVSAFSDTMVAIDIGLTLANIKILSYVDASTVTAKVTCKYTKTTD